MHKSIAEWLELFESDQTLAIVDIPEHVRYDMIDYRAGFFDGDPHVVRLPPVKRLPRHVEKWAGRLFIGDCTVADIVRALSVDDAAAVLDRYEELRFSVEGDR